MASVFACDEDSNIEYSIVDGRVRQARIQGQDIYDEDTDWTAEDWKAKVAEFVKRQKGHKFIPGRPLTYPKRFVHRLEEEGYLTIAPYTSEEIRLHDAGLQRLKERVKHHGRAEARNMGRDSGGWRPNSNPK